MLLGRRAGETKKLKWSNISLSNKSYTLSGDITKANEAQMYPLNEALIQNLEKLKHRNGYVVSIDGGLTPLGDHRAIWNSVKAQVGTKEMRLHDIGHLIGFIVVNNGGDIYVLQRILGHKNINTTQKYANVNLETKRVGIEKVHEIMSGRNRTNGKEN